MLYFLRQPAQELPASFNAQLEGRLAFESFLLLVQYLELLSSDWPGERKYPQILAGITLFSLPNVAWREENGIITGWLQTGDQLREIYCHRASHGICILFFFEIFTSFSTVRFKSLHLFCSLSTLKKGEINNSASF